MRAPSASTRVFALLGDPVRHSLSPRFQNAALEAAGADAVYLALRCGTGELPGLLRGLALAGGGGNVTLPHKEVAVAALDDPSPAVLRTGACNTFWGEDGRVRGDNTDVEGFRRALLSLTGEDAVPRRVLVLGAGGAARAACVGLLELEVGEVRLRNRTAARAEQLVREMADPRVRLEGEPGGGGFDLIVNATRLGLDPDDPLPVTPGEIAGAGGVLDLVYAPGSWDAPGSGGGAPGTRGAHPTGGAHGTHGDHRAHGGVRGGTRLTREAARLGIPAADGLEMLLQQGAAAFERWTGREAPIEAMRAALAGGGAGDRVGDRAGGPGKERAVQEGAGRGAKGGGEG